MASRALSRRLAVTTISSCVAPAGASDCGADCARAAPAKAPTNTKEGPIASDRRNNGTDIEIDSRLMPIIGRLRARASLRGLECERGRGRESDRWGVRPENEADARLFGNAVAQRPEFEEEDD